MKLIPKLKEILTILKIQNRKFDHVVEHHIFTLENGDRVLVHERELESDILHEGITEDKQYRSVFSEQEYSDDPIEIIGFEEVL